MNQMGETALSEPSFRSVVTYSCRDFSSARCRSGGNELERPSVMGLLRPVQSAAAHDMPRRVTRTKSSGKRPARPKATKAKAAADAADEPKQTATKSRRTA